MSLSADLNNKYKDMTYNDVTNFARRAFEVIGNIEKRMNDDPVMRLLKDKEKVALHEGKSFIDALFNSTTTESYLLTVEKIKQQLRIIIRNFDATEKKDIPVFRFDCVVDSLIEDITNFINENIKCDYQFKYEKIQKIEKEKNFEKALKDSQKNSASSQVPTVLEIAKLVLEYLADFDQLVETFSLVLVQSADFRSGQYFALKDCFNKNEYSKNIKVDNNKILDRLKNLKKINYLDILSDNYAEFLTTVLEACYYVFDYFITLSLEINNSNGIKYVGPSADVILGPQIDYYLDYIDANYEYNFLNNYFNFHKSFLNFDFKSFKDSYIKRFVK